MIPVTLPKSADAVLYSGVTESASVTFASLLLASQESEVTVVIAPENRRVSTLLNDFEFLLQKTAFQIQLLPASEEMDPDHPKAFDAFCDRLAALESLSLSLKKKHAFRTLLITTPAALMQSVPKPSSFSRLRVVLKSGSTIRFDELIETLSVKLGYTNEVVCEHPGQFSIRGGLIDVYPLNAGSPIRIDFFGDEIDSIREFDPTTQRSEKELKEVGILPASLMPTGEGKKGDAETTTVMDYLPEKCHWMIFDPDRMVTAFPDLFQRPENILPPSGNFYHVLKARTGKGNRWTGISSSQGINGLFADCEVRIPIESEPLDPYRPFADADSMGFARVQSEAECRKAFFAQLSVWAKQGCQLRFVLRNEGSAERFQELVKSDNLFAGLAPQFEIGPLPDGFRLKATLGATVLHVVYVTEAELFGRRKLRIFSRRRKVPERRAVEDALDFSELVDGDYLVHLAHGVCIFRGLQKLDANGSEEEVISLEFDGAVTLHVRLYESHLLSRYVGLAKSSPKLSRLGTNSWNKTRAAAEKATFQFAAELLALQSRRDATPGHSFGSDTELQRKFEASFPFSETPDQLQAIIDTKADMEKSRPMDRLLCGDVGFGKTEVALRAAFKAAVDGKQVAVLAPTTVLCQQHFNTFRERFAEYPVVVEMVSRFRSPSQRREILAQLAAGKIDVIIGTHTLLSDAVAFKDLGLLVIDEEHRFGVRQKERIKQLRVNVDVLSMSATPIPRTLYGALVGMRDLSVIETPPRDRLPIQTLVKGYDLEVIRKAIEFELDRGGQVFYLHNRVQTIEAVADKLKAMLPKARVGVGHGQMEEARLEKVMTEFVAGSYDILVCTTIIETGLDIPNCNTLIIEGADRFGLSQLYQLRGRVGRFNRQAYAYLLLHRHARMLEQARKRLNVIRQYNQLGAGYRIAMRDLELRGAGNLLGMEQSGHIAGVGFELYCQLLRQSISQLKGESISPLTRATVKLDFLVQGVLAENASAAKPEGPVFNERYADLVAPSEEVTLEVAEAALPTDYVSESRLRIDFYRRLALCTSEARLTEIEHELKDRFGVLPPAAQMLIKLTQVRVLAEQAQFSAIESRGSQLKCRMSRRGANELYKVGNRFPRLTQSSPSGKLKEIIQFLKLRLLEQESRNAATAESLRPL